MNPLSAAHLLSRNLFAQTGRSSFWMPPQASTYAEGVDWVFYFIFWISVFFFVLIVALMFVFVIRYRRRPGHKEQQTPTHSLGLELTWTLIPIVIVVLIFYYGFTKFLDMYTEPPKGAIDIQVEAQKWSWLFTYPNGVVDSDLHVPADRPVVLTMKSLDVIHSFFVPAFRIKRDVVPGRYSTVWFEATTPGEYDIFCAEYCGKDHWAMKALVIVHTADEFVGWMENAANYLDELPPADAGRQLYAKLGCKQCHSVDGTANTGPSFKNIFGHQQAMKNGETVLVNENYIRESILNPAARIAAGFDNVMPTYQGRAKEKDIDRLIAYIKSLADDYVEAQEAAAHDASDVDGHDGNDGATTATTVMNQAETPEE